MRNAAPIVALDAGFSCTGIGRYTEQLLQGLRPAMPQVELWCIVHPRNANRAERYADRVIPCREPMYSWAAQLVIPRLADAAQLLHCPHYGVPLFYRHSLSATIHDLTHLLDPSFRNSLKARVFARSLLRAAARKARRIITVSQYSKRVIVEHLGAAEEKIAVIYNSVSPVFAPMATGEAKGPSEHGGRVLPVRRQSRAAQKPAAKNIQEHVRLFTVLLAD